MVFVVFAGVVATAFVILNSGGQISTSVIEETSVIPVTLIYTLNNTVVITSVFNVTSTFSVYNTTETSFVVLITVNVTSTMYTCSNRYSN